MRWVATGHVPEDVALVGHHVADHLRTVLQPQQGLAQLGGPGDGYHVIHLHKYTNTDTYAHPHLLIPGKIAGILQ